MRQAPPFLIAHDNRLAFPVTGDNGGLALERAINDRREIGFGVSELDFFHVHSNMTTVVILYIEPFEYQRQTILHVQKEKAPLMCGAF